MMGTTKRNGEGWRIALEWPGRPEMAIGLSELKNQAIAVSDTFKRRWKNWHHLISAQSQKPLQEIVGLMAIAPTAFAADQCTSGLAFGSPKKFSKIAKAFKAEYLLVYEDQRLVTSPDWPGEFFEVS
jgi:thiamine biosynthesis lipoprotein ApbE